MTSNAVPILILGDAPNTRTGLARIARDLALHLYSDEVRGILPIHVGQLAFGYDGSPWPWPVYPVVDEENWALGDLERTWAWFAGDRAGVLLTVWDPARCAGVSSSTHPLIHRWGYFAIDGENPHGMIGGPAANALKAYYEILAYSRYGAGVIKRTLGYPWVRWLPHGIDMETFRPRGVKDIGEGAEAHGFYQWLGSREDAVVVGAVATNQPRKDLALLFGAVQSAKIVAAVRAAFLGVRDICLWLHVDRPITKAWSVPELADIFGFNDDHLLVTTGDVASDVQLAALYSNCDVTFAPGLGEGFGYPIAESLACGVPVVHVDYAAGTEIIPNRSWLVEPMTRRYEGPYAIARPVVHPFRVAEKIVEAVAVPLEQGYCRGAVRYLDWNYLWPRWRSWVSAGLKAFHEIQEKGKGIEEVNAEKHENL